MCTPRACSSLTSELPARNHSSSATTDRNARRFVVTAGKPSARSKRIVSPKIARVPTPVRSARSSPSASAFLKIARYWRTVRSGLDAAVDAAAGADPADAAARVADYLALQVLERPLETNELIVAGEGDRRGLRIGGPRLYPEDVVADRAVQKHAVPTGPKLDIGERGGVV